MALTGVWNDLYGDEESEASDSESDDDSNSSDNESSSKKKKKKKKGELELAAYQQNKRRCGKCGKWHGGKCLGVDYKPKTYQGGYQGVSSRTTTVMVMEKAGRHGTHKSPIHSTRTLSADTARRRVISRRTVRRSTRQKAMIEARLP